MRTITFAPLVALLLAPIGSLAASGNGRTTRYWDCCKPSCAWPGKANLLQGPARTCDRNGNTLSNANTKSGCDGGTAYTCTDSQPWAVNENLAYGFAATAISGGNEASWCCACYKLTFTSGPVAGKVMIVQSVNTGGDLGANHFDIQIPGGGVGLFDGCTPQFGQSLPGARYGGVSSRSECDRMPAALKAGCQWRFDWFKNADNPSVNFEQVKCPAELVAKSSCLRPDDSSFPAPNVPGGSGNPNPQPSTTSQTNNQPTNNPGTGTVPQWGQCGGQGYSGPTTCRPPFTCRAQNQWYSQCL